MLLGKLPEALAEYLVRDPAVALWRLRVHLTHDVEILLDLFLCLQTGRLDVLADLAEQGMRAILRAEARTRILQQLDVNGTFKYPLGMRHCL